MSAPPSFGWFAIKRGIFDHGFFAKELMSEREAWIWMIARASWIGTRHKVGTDMVDVPRGAFMATLREMQLAWGWRSDTRVRNFLKRLEAERMVRCEIVVRKNAQKTQLTLCNYEEYQNIERQENADKNARKTHGETHKRNKEEQVNKEEKEEEQLFPLNPDPAPKKERPRTRIPKNWVPSDHNIADAEARKFSVEEINHEADRFRDYHLAKGQPYADWNAAWRTWLGNARKFAAKPNATLDAIAFAASHPRSPRDDCF